MTVVRLFLFLLAVSVVACTTPGKEPRGSATHAAITEVLEEAAEGPPPQPAEPPAEVSRALLPEISVAVPEAADERFDVGVNEASAREFFIGLVAGTPYNIVVHPDVSGTISLQLRNVTIAEVLETVREVYGYGFRQITTGFVVLPATMQTRIFQVDYLDMARSGISRTRVSSGQVSVKGQGDQNQMRGDSGPVIFGGRERGGQEVTGSRIETTYEVDFWSEREETLVAIVGSEDGRKVVVNSQTGAIVVRAMPGELRDVSEYLATVEANAHRQVVLEAKIIEVELNDGFQAGINWAAVITANGSTYTAGQLSGRGQFDRELQELGGSDIVVGPGNPTTEFLSQTVGGAFVLALDTGDFNSFIELLEVQGDARVLSSPRVATLNNQKAIIKAGTDEFFITDISSNTVTGTASTTNRDVELTPFFSGIALDVTPQVSSDGEVILHIHPTVSNVQDQLKDIDFGASGEGTVSVPLALSEIRETDSIVKARSGQIIVIGGLMQNSMREQTFRTPVLGSLPGIGRLFRSTRELETKTELVILLKPIVVDDAEGWKELVEEPLERLRQMEAAAGIR